MRLLPFVRYAGNDDSHDVFNHARNDTASTHRRRRRSNQGSARGRRGDTGIQVKRVIGSCRHHRTCVCATLAEPACWSPSSVILTARAPQPRSAGHCDPVVACGTMTRNQGFEHFVISYGGSTDVRNASNGERSRGLKPAARNTKTGNTLECVLKAPPLRWGFGKNRGARRF